MSSCETTFTLPVPISAVVPAGVLAAAAVGKSASEQTPTSLVCKTSGWQTKNPATLKLKVAGVDGAALIHLVGSNSGLGSLNRNICQQEVEAFSANLRTILQNQSATTAAPPPFAAPQAQPAGPSPASVPQYATAALSCALCGRNRRPGAAFCSGCGAGFARHCPSCGGALSADASFCQACGHGLTASSAPSPSAVPATQTEIAKPAAPLPSAPAVAMGKDLVDTPILRLARIAFPILAFAPWIVSAAQFLLPASWPFVRELAQLYTPIMAPFEGLAKSIASGMQMPPSEIVWLVAGLAYFVLAMLLFAIVGRVLHQKVVLVPQAELDARFQASKELKEGLAVIYLVVIVLMVIYWFVNNPVVIWVGL